MKEKLFSAVEIEINHGCNMSCSYCPNSQFQRIEKGEMELSLYQKIISQLKDLNFTGRISYDFYNEPMLCSKLLEFVAIARKELPETTIELYSNGTFLSVEKFRELIFAGISKFIVTKHENVQKYLFDETYQTLSEAEKSLVLFRGHEEMTLFNRGGTLPHIGEKRNLSLQPCYVPSEVLTITVKGNVVPCFEDFFQKHQMGNVNEMHLRDIWFQEKYLGFRKKLQQGLRHQLDVCKDCNRHQVVFA